LSVAILNSNSNPNWNWNWNWSLTADWNWNASVHFLNSDVQKFAADIGVDGVAHVRGCGCGQIAIET